MKLDRGTERCQRVKEASEGSQLTVGDMDLCNILEKWFTFIPSSALVEINAVPLDASEEVRPLCDRSRRERDEWVAWAAVFTHRSRYRMMQTMTDCCHQPHLVAIP